MKKLLKKKYSIIIIILLALCVGYGTYSYVKGNNTSASSDFVEYKVEKKDINTILSGSGAVSSTYRQDLSSKVSGTIKQVFFNEGDNVKEGDLLVEFDNSQISNTIEKTKLNIKQAQTNVENSNKNISYLNVISPIIGQVSNILIAEGDNVNKGAEICTITDTTHLKLTVPFNQNAASDMYIGQIATVYLQDYMDTVNGTITYIGNASNITDGGGRVQNIEISIINPGALKSGITASASVGNSFSTTSSTIKYRDVKKVRTQVSGTVKNINVNEYQNVNTKTVLVTLENDDLYTQLESAQVNLEGLNLQLNTELKNLDDYKIYAVHDGTIVKQDSKSGDFVQSGTVITSVSNSNAMEFNIDIDELDISKIKIGMEADITIDALTEKKFNGKVTAINSEGTNSNGVTTYPVTVEIISPDGIKEGMNANANIVIESKKNVLTLPVGAVQTMGNRSFVLVKGAKEDTNSKESNNRNLQASKSSSSKIGNQNINGTIRKMITIGISDDENIEIVSGLNEGESVLVIVKKSSTTTNSNQKQPTIGLGGGIMSGRPSDGSQFNRQSTGSTSSKDSMNTNNSSSNRSN